MKRQIIVCETSTGLFVAVVTSEPSRMCGYCNSPLYVGTLFKPDGEIVANAKARGRHHKTCEYLDKTDGPIKIRTLTT